MTDGPRPDKTIDERLEAITQTLELVAGMQTASEERIDKLTKIVEVHEQERQRAGRAIRAALDAWFNGNGEEQQ